MANTVIALKKSATPSSAPADLANGELAINYADGKLFYKAANGSIQSISSGTPSFGTVNAAGTLLIADTINDVLDIRSGDNIIITGDAINDKLTIASNLSPANNWANTKLTNGTVTLAGSLTTTGSVTTNGYLYINAEGGEEGGEIQLLATGSNTNWSIDSYQNNFRVFARSGTTVSNLNFFHATGGSVRLGVNKTDPGYAVDVTGDMNISGTYRVNGTPISAGSTDLTPANNFAGLMANSSNAYAISLIPAPFNKANDAYSLAGSAYDKANSANVLAFGTGIGANNWANTLAFAGNAYALQIATDIGTAGNNYTNAVGASSNNWANTKLSNTSGVTFGGTLNISENLRIGNSITNVTSVIFNTGTNITPATPGELTWSQDDSTLRFNMDSPSNVIGHIGQDSFYLIKNQTGSAINKGEVVRFAGTLGSSGRLLGAKAIANNSYPSKYIIGVAAATINDGDDGFVISQGKLRGIDTSMFSEGDILYVSPTTIGGLSNTMPTAPNNKITVAAVVKKDNLQGTIEVRVTLGSKLNEDEYVEINGIANGDMLMYISANGRFENRPQSAVNAGLLDGYDTSSANVPNTVVVRDQWGNFNAGNITCSLSNTGTIDMRLSAADPGQIEGRIWYDGNVDHALNYYTDITGVSVAIGRQQVFRVRNTTANTFTVGQAVYISGGSVAKVPDIDLAIADDLLKSQVIGVVFGANIGPNSFGYVLSMGTYVHGDTNSYGPEGTRLYLSSSTPGALQNTIPPSPYHPVQIGVVTYQNNAQGTILISIQRLSGLNLANGSVGFLIDGTQARISEDNANLRFDTSNSTLYVAKANVNILHVGNINVQPAFVAVNNHISGVTFSGNAYALATATSIGTAGNNYTVAVGTAGNNYSNAVGASSNNWANTLATAGNNYTITIFNQANAAFSKANTSGSNSFSTINVSSQSNVTASLANDVLILEAGGGINITTNAITKTITFSQASTIDYGLIDGAITNQNDYGSIA